MQVKLSVLCAADELKIMKEEMDDAHTAHGSNSKTDLATETQAFETEFIKTYQSLPELWDPTHSHYTNKYRRAAASDVLLKKMRKWDSTATRVNVRQKINILRSCYRKDLRRHLTSKTIGPNGEEIYEYNPKSWKFYALRFLGGKIDEESNHLQDNSIEEINLDGAHFDDEENEEENKSQTSDALQMLTADQTREESLSFIQKHRKRRVEYEISHNDVMFDKELEAISSNVACKLKRMNPTQRCYAELLINKVLIGGLQNSFTDETDLTEIYKYVE